MAESSSATGNIITNDPDQSQEVETYLKQRHILSRVETNIERLSIWCPQPKRGTVFTPCKVIELEPERLPDGNLIKRRVEIIPSAKYGYPTLEAQEVWYAFQYLWHDSPTKDLLTEEAGRVGFSRKQVIEGVLGKSYGRNQRKSFDRHVLQLATTHYQFNYAFYDKEKDEWHREIKGFNLIRDYHLTERKNRYEVIHDKCFVVLHPLVVSNLRCGYFKPVLLSVVSQLRSDIAKLLYRKVDSHFAYYAKYEISTQRFFRENGLVGGEYHQPGRRKRLLEKAIQELVGKPTSSGAVISKHEFARTVDGKDWKLIVRAKGKRVRETAEVVSISQASTRQQEPSQKPHKPRQEAEKTQARGTTTPTPKKPLEVSSEVLEVLDYFDKVFGLGGDGGKQHSQNVVAKAEAFIKRDGLEKTKFLIDFARREAPKTDYQPRSFNGITQYRSDALKAWKADVRLRERQERESRKIAQIRLENARSDHERAFENEYYEYVNELVCSLGDEYPESFNEFRCWQAEERRQKEEELEGNVMKEKALEVFDREGQILLRLSQFFKANPAIHIPDFWEWDSAHNPNSFR